MTHLLTDEMILEIMNTTGPCDPAYFGERHPSPEEMRAAYDKGRDDQLEQDAKLFAEYLVAQWGFAPVIADLRSKWFKEAMRPQEDN